uniref:Macro domain-containing protein n=1 Tax=Hucho hucho TaxID=62062 RepID=A0A4W5RYQ2_9TELE
MAFQMLTLSSRIRAIGPLSRCRSGDCHTSDIGVCSKFTNIFGVANRQVYPLVRSGQSSANSSPAKCKDILKPGGIHFANRVEKFSTTTAAAKSFESFQGQNKASTSGGKYGSLYRIALAALGVTTAVVSLHASAHLAMATGSERLNLDSAKGDWNEVKDALLHMSQEERRKHYRTTYLSLDEVPVWTAKSLVDTGGDSVKGTKFKRNEALDKKISLFSGDITKLEIDGIVNAANKTLLGGGGGVRAEAPSLQKYQPTGKSTRLNFTQLSRAVVTNRLNAMDLSISKAFLVKHCLLGGPREQIKCAIGLPLANRIAQNTVSAVT